MHPIVCQTPIQNPLLLAVSLALHRSSSSKNSVFKYRQTNPIQSSGSTTEYRRRRRRRGGGGEVRCGVTFRKFDEEVLQRIRAGERGHYPEEDAICGVAEAPVDALVAAAGAVRDERGWDANIVTFSPKVFIPLTRACRDSCAYCTFAVKPRKGHNIYMTPDEVLQLARKGVDAGCTEALFTLGDKPELVYPAAMDELRALGHFTTISYAAEMAKLVLEDTGLLPHINAGIISENDMRNLRLVSVSQGLMLESLSERLLECGGPHHACPDKVPMLRVQMLTLAGQLKIPFTSGLLIGIGETREERVEDLLLLRSLHQEYGHIQELIIQNFRAKRGTYMVDSPEPSLEELKWTIAMARLIFGPLMNIQAPPNLTPASDDSCNGSQWKALIDAGINDWGGISPITRDWVNPEAPWPHVDQLARVTLQAGKVLVPRLAVYPQYVRNAAMWMDNGIMKGVYHASDSLGYARGDIWSPGLIVKHESGKTKLTRNIDGTVNVASHKLNKGRIFTCEKILDKAVRGEELYEDEIEKLFGALGDDLQDICLAADNVRYKMNGQKVTYVVNRNINYTNICKYRCAFCAFSKGQVDDKLRGKPYLMALEEISQRTIEAWNRGATEVCMQGGIHPGFSGQTYLDILHAVKSVVPQIHVHAFSPLEVFHGATTLGISIESFLIKLKEAGLGSLPGTAAEVLDDEVRKILCWDKITTQQWLKVIEIAHCLQLRTTATIMFGHIDNPKHWAKHIIKIRELQKATGGFTEFVPLPFVHMEAPLYLKGKARRGPTKRECVLMHAISRLALHPYIPNVQASWVKMGPEGAKFLLSVGCNDMGGSLMNESITRAAGASHGQELHPVEMDKLIRSIGRIPQQRTTLYEAVSSADGGLQTSTFYEH